MSGLMGGLIGAGIGGLLFGGGSFFGHGLGFGGFLGFLLAYSMVATGTLIARTAGIVALIVTAKYLHLPDPTKRRPIDFLGSALFAIAVTVPLVLALTWFIGRTRAGRAMRATAQDPEAARRWKEAIREMSKGDHYLPVLWGDGIVAPNYPAERPPHDYLKLIGTALLVVSIVAGVGLAAGRYGQTPMPVWLKRALIFVFAGSYIYFQSCLWLRRNRLRDCSTL